MSQKYPKSKKHRILAVFFAISFIVTISLSNASLTTNQLSFGFYANAQNSNVSQLVELGIKYYDSGKFREAVEEWKAALEIYQNKNQLREQAIVRGNLARGYQKLGDLEQTVKQWQQVVTLHQQLQNQGETGRALTELAQAYSSLGQHKKAIEFLCGVEESETSNCLGGSALEIAKSEKDEQGIVAALGSLGEVYRKLANDDLAIKYLESAEKISGKNQNYLILNSLGNVYLSKALLWNIRAESALISRPDKLKEFENQAINYAQNAHQRFADSLQIAIDKNDESAQMVAIINLIQLYSRSRQLNLFDENQLNQAIEKALAILDKLPDSTQKVYAAIDLANLPGSNIVNPPLTQCAFESTI